MSMIPTQEQELKHARREVERLRAHVEELEAELERRDRELVCCKDCWDAGKRP